MSGVPFTEAQVCKEGGSFAKMVFRCDSVQFNQINMFSGNDILFGIVLELVTKGLLSFLALRYAILY